MQSKIDYFAKRLEKIREGIETMKQFGIDDRILVAWLCHEIKISEKQAKLIVSKIEEFYDLIIKQEVLNGLKDSKS